MYKNKLDISQSLDKVWGISHIHLMCLEKMFETGCHTISLPFFYFASSNRRPVINTKLIVKAKSWRLPPPRLVPVPWR